MRYLDFSQPRAAALLVSACCFYVSTVAAQWPNTPLATSGRWITDSSGNVVQLAGVNWPSHTAAMIPEGLQYQSIASIVSRVKQAGFNVVRLTYASEMIDQLYAGGQQQPSPDVSLRSAVNAVFGSGDAGALLDGILSHNPSLSADTTRLALFDAIAAECARQHIYIHLDNHVSKAGWCCTPLDGNSWWGDTSFDVGNWTRSLSYMANHGKSWPSLISMSLRNELRPPLNNISLLGTSYNWATWYTQMQLGAAAIHSANSDLLVYLSGLDGDTTLGPVVQATPLTPGQNTFDRDDFAPNFAGKLVLELHVYWNIEGALSGGSIESLSTTCDPLNTYLDKAGFSTLTNTSDRSRTQYPMVLTEFGFDQSPSQLASLLTTTTNGNSATGYAQCLFAYLRDRQVPGWMLWPLSGSYYIREGERDADEPWGLLTHDWSGWRADQFINEVVRPAVQDTLKIAGKKPLTSESNGAGAGDGGTAGGSAENGSNGDGKSWGNICKGQLDFAMLLGIAAAVAASNMLMR